MEPMGISISIITMINTSYQDPNVWRPYNYSFSELLPKAAANAARLLPQRELPSCLLQ